MPATAPLLRIELRRNAMLWVLPVAIGLFYYHAYRHVMVGPALWNERAMSLQNDTLLDFVAPVTGAAAWTGWRESRRAVTEMLTSTARPRWARHLATWAASTCWAMAGYVACVGVVYAITARQVAWGGPLWWPAVVGAAGIPVLSAFGFAAGVLFPSRFTTPLVVVIAFAALLVSDHPGGNSRAAWALSPLVAGSAAVGADPNVAIFYHYLPDLPIAQVMFLAGLTMVLLGAIGLPATSGGWRLRTGAAALAAAGLAAAGTAVGLAGTARLDAHGMTVIPALHDAASDQPIRYTPACGGSPVQICLHPLYAADLAVVISAVEPVLSQVAGLPGAPARLSQALPEFVPGQGSAPPANPSEFALTGVPGAADDAGALAANAAFTIGRDVLGVTQGPPASGSPAQQAVLSALLTGSPSSQLSGLASQLVPPGSPAAAAARRFAALPAAARHRWLVQHIAALRDGGVTLAQLP